MSINMKKFSDFLNEVDSTPKCDWSYFDQRVQKTGAKHRLLDVETKVELEKIAQRAAGSLGSVGWAEVIGYGNDAIAVFKVNPPHKYSDYSKTIVVKISESNPEWYQKFHKEFKLVKEAIESVKSNQRLQKTIDLKTDMLKGKQVFIQILGYMPGNNLEDSVNSDGLESVRQFLKEIIIPLWAAGLRFFDFRAANLIYSKEAGMQLIDLDMISKGYIESLRGVWSQRDTLENTAIKRLPGIIQRLLELDNLNLSVAKIKDSIKSSNLNEKLSKLGRENNDTRDANYSVDHLVDILKSNF
jgi:hypothetical protein